MRIMILEFVKCHVAAFSLSLTLALAACASGPRLVDHSFAFDVLADSPEATLLDYRYGTSNHPGARPPDWALAEGSHLPAALSLLPARHVQATKDFPEVGSPVLTDGFNG